MKVFFRVKNIPGTNNTVPYNYNIANALDGALQCGLECIPYQTVSEIIDKYMRGDIVLDGIEQVQYCLNKFHITVPELNYPKILEKYLGRRMWKDTINSIASDESKWSAGNFVKPMKEKVFTGKVISSIKDLIGCGSCYEDYEVWVSEPLDIIYECRGFVYYDKLIDLRPYKGDYKYIKYMDTNLIENAMKDWKDWRDRPNSCSLDFGVVCECKDKNSGDSITGNDYLYKTVLIEANTSYALGCYGLMSIDYIKLISAYISQISGVKDELYF